MKVLNKDQRCSAHPDRVVLARELCQSCYVKQRRKERKKLPPLAKGKRGRPAGVKVLGQTPITLRLRHTINGVGYGPGTVTVGESLAASLLETESRAVAEEERFLGKRGVLILGGGRTREVPYDSFDAALGGVNPVGVIDEVGQFSRT